MDGSTVCFAPKNSANSQNSLIEFKKGGHIHRIKCHEGTEKVQIKLYPFFNLGARWGVWSTPRFTPGKEPRNLMCKP